MVNQPFHCHNILLARAIIQASSKPIWLLTACFAVYFTLDTIVKELLSHDLCGDNRLSWSRMSYTKIVS